MRQKINLLLNDTKNKKARTLSMFIQTLIVISLILSSVNTLPNLSNAQIQMLELFEIITVLLFTTEYIVRIVVSDSKLKYVFSFYGIIDLLAVLPFYLALGFDLNSIKVLRLLRILKFSRHNKALKRLQKAILIAREELIVFSFITFLTLYLTAVGIYHFENQAQPESFSSVFHSLWWAVVTLTTVGFGDMFPVTTGGKIFTFFVLMIGIGVISVPMAIISSALTEAKNRENRS